MPKRLLDGERLWTSEKLRKVSPESFRAEYSNMLPLALANGVFECTPLRIWRDVYSFNRPAFKPEKVAKILNEFERVRLLFRWKEEEKVWGFWVGIKKEGLLPPKSQMERRDYKTGPEPPLRLLDDFLCYQIDSGLNPKGSQCDPNAGFALASGSPLVSISSQENEVDMSLKNDITDKARAVLGIRLNPQSNDWKEISSLGRVYTNYRVSEAFENWAQTRKGEIVPYPLSDFIKIADGMILTGTILLGDNIDLDKLLSELYTIGSQAFTGPQRNVVNDLVKKHGRKEVVLAYKEFFGNLNEYKQQYAPKDFCEGGAVGVLGARVQRKEAASHQKEQLEQALAVEQERSKLEQEKVRAAQLAEEELAEDTL